MWTMECNKDEACNAKEIAMQKMAINDFEGARKAALKAKQLYPELDNISQLIAVCDIHCSAQKKIYGSTIDLYGILQIEKLADETTIKKQYRKLALLLHPDKNKFAGAEAAFKLIGEANMVLSNKEKRSAYDVKCKEPIKTSVTKIPKCQKNQTSNAGQNKSKNAPKAKFNGLNRSQKSTSKSNIRSTFWTSCPFCKIQYEYYREFVNVPLRCHNCFMLFIAYEIGAQREAVGPGFANEKMHGVNVGSKPVFQQKVKADKQRDEQIYSNFACKKTEDTMKQEVATKSKVNVQKPMETVTVNNMDKKRGRTTESSYDEKEAVGDGVSGGFGGNTVDQKKSLRKKQHVSYFEDGDDEISSPKRSKPVKVSDDVEDIKKEHVLGDVRSPNDTCHIESDSEPELVDCPDQEFINFDKNKEENCFAVDQIWACYDSVDGMPRFYAEIQKIYSPQFKLRVTWLEPEPEDDFEIRWVEEGLPVACGKFTRGETVETRDRLMFSHQMVCKKNGGSGISYFISPQKGEIWALFKNWDIKWSLDPESPKKFKFEIVEILSVNDGSVSVALLSKVKGFVSVFQRIICAGVADHMIPSNERFRFSHRIQSAKLTGTERDGVPAGSFELDMASLPVDLENMDEEKVKPSANFANTPKKDKNGLDKSEVGSEKVKDGQNSFPPREMKISHDFRSDKHIWKFQVGQIWAFWERDKETRQQRYAEIKQIDRDASKLHVSLLKLCNNSNKSSNRYNNKPYDACGVFKASAGKPKFLAPDSFSHIVKADACGNKMLNIFPRENQIWALFKEAGGCEIVQVIETDEVSIKVMSLTCVFGFKSVFKVPMTESLTGKIVVIPRVELSRFSHQIPAFLFENGLLKGCWELDPEALTGLHLLEANQS